ncbi:MAG: glycosyltransferase family 9 protein [Ignavibacteriaceae bacterium]|jgi:heptosyltransferase-2
MSQIEIIPLVEKFYPVKLFVKALVWSYCKIARLNILKNSAADRVVVISLHRIGDSIFTTYAIKKIVEFYKDKSISIICFSETKVIFQMSFPSVEILAIPHTFFWHGRIATREAKSILRGANAEIIYDLTGAITSATLIASSSTKKIIGMNLEYFEPLYDYYAPIRTKPHLIDTYLDVVKLVIPVENNFTFEFPIVASETNKILIHPHAGWKAKEWGINKYFELAQRLSSQYEVEFITEVNSLSKDDKKVICENFRLIETKSVKDLIEQTRDCSAFIGNDSGPVYIANLLGKPTFTIYGPTNSEYSKPFGEHHAEIHQEISCSPIATQYCFTDAGRKCPDYICMRNLTVDEVYNEILDFLSKEKIPKCVI